MADQFSADFPPLVSREHARNTIGDALRLFVGRGRRFSVKQLANGTGVKDRCIECAMCRADNVDYRPLPEWALLSIAAFLGTAFTNEWLKLAGQVASDAADLDHDDLAAKSLDYAAEHARARHPGSPGGVAIVAEEEGTLNAKAANLRVAR